MNRNISWQLKQEILRRDKFTCQKCGFINLDGTELEIHHMNMRVDGRNEEIGNLITLCSICHHYSPEDEANFAKYLKEKIDGNLLNTFRKSERSVSRRTRKGMVALFKEGKMIVRAPLGYKIIDKELLPAENSYIVQEIFQTFLNTNISLTQLAKKYNLSVNGLKKILANKTYLGKVKFGGETAQGKHTALISEELFNKVQEKLS